MITVEQAHEMGAKGGPVTEQERLLFEAWMKGHCWMLHGDWTGETYVHEAETTSYLHPGAMLTRQLWAAWRDRAALAEQPAPMIRGDIRYGLVDDEPAPVQQEPDNPDEVGTGCECANCANGMGGCQMEDAQQQEWVEAACALIKAADDAAADSDYMLDSDDCIKVLRGEWTAPLMNDCPRQERS